MKPRFESLAVLLLAMSFVGCETTPKKGTDNARPLPTPEEALNLVLGEADHRTSMRSMGRVTYFGEQGRVRLRSVLVVERPGRFRVETLSPLEAPIDVMVSDGERIALLSAGKLRRGPATPENVARLIPVELWPRELVDVMLGGFPGSDRYKPTELKWSDEDSDAWLLALEGDRQKRVEMLIDPERHAVKSAKVINKEGKVEIALRFEKNKAVDPLPGVFPRRIVFEIPDQELEVTIKLQDVELNVDIPPTLFEIEAPPGIVAERMDSPPIRLPVRTSSAANPQKPE